MNQTQDFATERWPISRPKPYPKNARKWSQKAIEKVAASIREFGWRQPLVCDTEDVIVIGHLRLAAAQLLGLEAVPVHVARDLSPAKVRALRLADNRLHSEAAYDEGLLREEMLDLQGLDLEALSLTGFDSDELAAMFADPPPPPVSLSDRFIVPPFSVLDARQGYWQDRKRAWLALGIQSELGRGGGTWRESATGSPIDRKQAYDAR